MNTQHTHRYGHYGFRCLECGELAASEQDLRARAEELDQRDLNPQAFDEQADFEADERAALAKAVRR